MSEACRCRRSIPLSCARRSEIVAALRAIVPGEGVIDDDSTACVPTNATRCRPTARCRWSSVLPETVAQVSAILRYCQDNKVKVVPRGAGTSLSGGSMPVGDAILLGLGKFNRVLEIDYANRCARVQPGVTNLGISSRGRARGLLLRRPTPARRSPARSAATWRRIPAACTA